LNNTLNSYENFNKLTKEFSMKKTRYSDSQIFKYLKIKWIRHVSAWFIPRTWHQQCGITDLLRIYQGSAF